VVGKEGGEVLERRGLLSQQKGGEGTNVCGRVCGSLGSVLARWWMEGEQFYRREGGGSMWGWEG